MQAEQQSRFTHLLDTSTLDVRPRAIPPSWTIWSASRSRCDISCKLVTISIFSATTSSPYASNDTPRLCSMSRIFSWLVRWGHNAHSMRLANCSTLIRIRWCAAEK